MLLGEVIAVVGPVLDTEQARFLQEPIAVLSPHADDAAFSCGGMLLQHKDAKVITVCSAEPESPRPNYLSGLASVEIRMQEDRAAMDLLGCQYETLGFSDAVDRTSDGNSLYSSISELFGVLSPVDVAGLQGMVEQCREAVGARRLVCPMAVGAHVDHQLCAHVGRILHKEGHDVWFYPDAPYCFPDPGPIVIADTALLASRRLRARIWSNREIAIDTQAKATLVALYPSQVGELFGDLLSYEYLAEDYYHHIGGPLELYHQLRW